MIPLTLKGSLTIGNDNSFFNANGLGLNIYQSLINNNTSASTALNVGRLPAHYGHADDDLPGRHCHAAAYGHGHAT